MSEQEMADKMVAAAVKHAKEYPYWENLTPEMQRVWAFLAGVAALRSEKDSDKE